MAMGCEHERAGKTEMSFVSSRQMRRSVSLCHSAFKTWTYQPRSSTYCKNTSQYSWQSSQITNV